MTTIISKSGTGIPASDKLETAELAVDTSNGNLYTKLDDGSVVKLNDGSGDGSGEDGRITDTQISNWDEAYGWGDHSTEGYLTEFIESDPTVPQYVKDITQDDIDRWNAGGGGSGGGAGVLMSDTEPADKTEGMMWMDTSTSPAVVWIWDGAAWVEFPFVGGGGSDGSGGGSGPKLPELQYLVIGGGGTGGCCHTNQATPTDANGMPGGGGAGGYRTNVPGDRSGGDSDPEVTPLDLTNIPAYTQFVIRVGAGGQGKQGTLGSSASQDDWMNSAQNGKPSSIEDVDGNPIIVAEGGGFGAHRLSTNGSWIPPSINAGDGGSGGGGVGGNTTQNPQSERGGKGIAGQGFDGKTRGVAVNSNISGGGGGGGAGSEPYGADGTNNRDGMNGGLGLVSSIDGLNIERAGGGAGNGGRTAGTATGGGGQAASNGIREDMHGQPNTGGGGGGHYGTTSGSWSSFGNTNGGSGVVIIRYLGPQVCFGGEVTTHNGYTVHTFNSDGVFTVGSLT